MTHRHLLATCAALLLAAAPLSRAQTAAATAPPAASAVAGAASAVLGAAKAAVAPAAETSEGKVAYYGAKFAGRKTASGERFNPNALTMAHKTLPFGTLVRVTNLKTNKSVVVRVNDRGPSTPDRIGDVSRGAAAKLRMLRTGVTQARLEVVGQAKGHGQVKAKARHQHKHH